MFAARSRPCYQLKLLLLNNVFMSSVPIVGPFLVPVRVMVQHYIHAINGAAAGATQVLG